MHVYLLNFNVRVFAGVKDGPSFSMREEAGLKTILDLKSDTSLLKTNATINLADPYLFVSNSRLYLFYERLDTVYGKGRICMRSTDDLINWTEEVDVLVEPFHLSFPYVFEDNGKVYMLPESGENNTISLYEASDETLTKWSLIKNLRENEQWYDSTIVRKDGHYYLFTGDQPISTEQTQHLFVSESLLGPYKEHPSSPIYRGLDGGRNAGSIIECDGKYYRPIQVCMNSYGEQTNIMNIESLTPTEYKESVYLKSIIDTARTPFKYGGHQWNQVDFLGKRIIAIDYRVPNYNIIELYRRLRLKFINHS